jgi:Rps23 Pro-64 3,4-dihydroxylase Tpa1-like proline 4-hydroxylase
MDDPAPIDVNPTIVDGRKLWARDNMVADPQAALNEVLSVEMYLRPSLRGSESTMKEVSARLAAGGLVAIREAFEPAFAERIYHSLDTCTTWRVYEEYQKHFHYHHHNLYQVNEYPQDLAFCSKVFDSTTTKAWVTRLSGRRCVGPTQFSASWYLPGDHSLPHDDNVATDVFKRQVAFVWHLAKNWRSEWGGALFWCPKALYLSPVFNTLLLFNVGPDTNHFVTQVSPYAQGKRLTINGWWTGPGATGTPVRPTPDRIDTGGVQIEFY